MKNKACMPRFHEKFQIDFSPRAANSSPKSYIPIFCIFHEFSHGIGHCWRKLAEVGQIWVKKCRFPLQGTNTITQNE